MTHNNSSINSMANLLNTMINNNNNNLNTMTANKGINSSNIRMIKWMNQSVTINTTQEETQTITTPIWSARKLMI